MIEEKDVDTFIKAKRDQLAIDILQVLSALSLTALIVLEALQLEHGYTILLATMSAVLIGGAMGQSRWVAVSRNQLVQTLERIISRDPEALKMMAERKRASDSTSRHT